MAKEDLMPVTYEKVGYRWEPPKGDFTVEVQPIFAKEINLCGYSLEFKRLRDPDTGQWVYPIYTLDSRKFPPKVESDLKSVLPEILIKLTNPLAPSVNIKNTEKIAEIEKTEKQVKSKTEEKRNA